MAVARSTMHTGVVISQSVRCFERGFRMSNEEKTPKIKFFDGVKAEFKKIIWPDKDTLLKQSIAVVAVSIVLGAIIALIDMLMQYGVNFLTM